MLLRENYIMSKCNVAIHVNVVMWSPWNIQSVINSWKTVKRRMLLYLEKCPAWHSKYMWFDSKTHTYFFSMYPNMLRLSLNFKFRILLTFISLCRHRTSGLCTHYLSYLLILTFPCGHFWAIGALHPSGVQILYNSLTI